MIVALCGEMGTGKTWLVQRVLRPRSFIDMAFADELKIMLIARGILSYEEAYLTKPQKMREACYRYGTVEGWRVPGQEYIWCRALEARLRRLRDAGMTQDVVISDVRFPHELDWAKAANIPVIRLRAPQRCARAADGAYGPSVDQERGLDDLGFPFAATVRNDPEDAGYAEGSLLDAIERLRSRR